MERERRTELEKLSKLKEKITKSKSLSFTKESVRIKLRGGLGRAPEEACEESNEEPPETKPIYKNRREKNGDLRFLAKAND